MSEGLRKVSLPVTGMNCAACARRVEKALSGAEGVSRANVNLAAERATVEYDPVSSESGALVRTIEGAGYGVEKSKAGFGVTGMSCAACVGRVEKALRNVPGVLGVNVNLATERATVEHLAGVTEVADLERTVEGAGYGLVWDGEEARGEDARARVPAAAEDLHRRGPAVPRTSEALRQGVYRQHDPAPPICIEMAKVAARETANPELKDLAKGIVEAQKREISQMEQWRQQWCPQG